MTSGQPRSPVATGAVQWPLAMAVLPAVAGCFLALARTTLAEMVEPDSEPLWEIGVVGGGGYLPDYPAADENHVNGLALPFAIYRGEVFRLGDRGAARGIVVDDGGFELDLGLDAAFPVDSDNSDAREGMNDLDFLLEVGPRLTYRFLPPEDRDELDLALAVRAVLSTDFSNLRYQGLTVAPSLTYRRNDFLLDDMRAVVSVGPLFGFDGLNDYFYRVAPSEARPGRPAYEADDGYMGTELSAGLSWGIRENLRLFGGVQLGYWGGSANDDSPLHRQDLTIGVGGGLRWSILTSERRVAR
ncbi:MAG: MipA/OmpV family protein [Geminicoccaceae bacterium]|nr:MipA/OmpV family protein [Geminicoccaceae bacterium]MCB9966332.1 MipA/OmpV family protein [Geminicoccaceae bacterium]HRY25597.1 MipA/OmpV family protein [Geminicoccaceae bacterium]